MSKLPKSDLDCYWSATGRAESTHVNPSARPLNPAPVPGRTVPDTFVHLLRQDHTASTTSAAPNSPPPGPGAFVCQPERRRLFKETTTRAPLGEWEIAKLRVESEENTVYDNWHLDKSLNKLLWLILTGLKELPKWDSCIDIPWFKQYLIVSQRIWDAPYTEEPA